ncbi:MAG: RNA 2'-phosphotransferase [Chloroflexota bacterium]|nr:RNA 2'-phosphotransferase [Chloroflexota bacterium]
MKRHRRLVKLSKFLALILRHQPERFALELDEQGWASLSEVMEILKGLPNFRWANRSDLMAIAEGTTGDGKKRFQVEEGRIRALYGHSFERPIRYQPTRPPARLYHGTSPDALDTIRSEGLRPMDRQYVHLSPDRETAVTVGSRHAPRPVVITVRAGEAHDAGIAFYHPEQTIYLSEPVPPRFLELP